MAIYHCKVKPISRSSGRSSVAAAAYRSGQRLTDERTGLVHDYTKKNGVEYTNIITPHDIEVSRDELWNAAEAAEKRKDSRTAREIIVALPHEISHEERIDLINQFGKGLSNRYGCAIDIAIHAPSDGGDLRNYHAHILMTTREIHAVDNRLQLGAKTALELNNTKRGKLGIGKTQDEIKLIRKGWEVYTNKALEKSGKSERVDHRSYKERKIDREATIHEGVVATNMKRRGVDTAPVIYNKNVKSRNEERQKLKDVVRNFDKELDTLTTERMDIEKQLEVYKLDKPAGKDNSKESLQPTPFSKKLDEIRANLETSGKVIQSIDFGAAQQNIANNIERVQLSQEIAIRQLAQQVKEVKVKETPIKEYTKEQVLGAALKTIRVYNAAVQQQIEKIKSERPKVNNQPDLERIARERKQIEFERQQLGPRPMLIGQERWEQRNNELNTRLFELNTKEKDLQTRHDPEQARDKTRAIAEVQREQPGLAQRHEKAQQYLERENNPQKAEKAQRLAEARAIGEREATMTRPERDKEREAAAERQRNYDRQR